MFSTQYSDYTMDHHKYSPDLIHTVSDFSMVFSMHLRLLQQIPTNLCHFIPPRHLEQQITPKSQLNQSTRHKTFTICYAIHRGLAWLVQPFAQVFFSTSTQPTPGGRHFLEVDLEMPPEGYNVGPPIAVINGVNPTPNKWIYIKILPVNWYLGPLFCIYEFRSIFTTILDQRKGGRNKTPRKLKTFHHQRCQDRLVWIGCLRRGEFGRICESIQVSTDLFAGQIFPGGEKKIHPRFSDKNKGGFFLKP